MRRIVNHPRRSRGTGLLLAALPFVLLIAAYLIGSQARLAVNPNDKLLPGLLDLRRRPCATWRSSPDKRCGDYLFWIDTAASLLRLADRHRRSPPLIGLVLGIAIGLIPAMSGPRCRPSWPCCRMVPPLGRPADPVHRLRPGRARQGHADRRSASPPTSSATSPSGSASCRAELLIKAQTLGASSWQIVTRVVGPMILPRLITGLRLSLGPAWLFLIAAEAIAATEGLGYRIFLVRRFLAMDVILPYVAWITLLAFVTDRLLARLSRRPLRLGRDRDEPGAGPASVEELRRPQRARADQPRRGERQLRHPGGCLRLRQEHLPAHPPGPGAGQPRHASWSTARRCRTSRGRERGIVFQRYSVFPHLTVLGNVILGLELDAGTAGGAGSAVPRAGSAIEQGAAMLDAVGLGHVQGRHAGLALGRHAAAARDRPGADPQAEAAPARRAVRRPRPRHPRRHARAGQAALARDGHDRVHGHPRPRRGVRAGHARPHLRQGPA